MSADSVSDPPAAQLRQVVAMGTAANRRIATRLRVSEKTIERHLTTIFARTGFRSRVALARAHLDGTLRDRTT